jgi:hypothetical protein
VDGLSVNEMHYDTVLLNIAPHWYSLSERLLVPSSCANLAVVIRQATGDPDVTALMDLHPGHLNTAPFSQFVPPCGACWATGVCWGILTTDRQASLMGSIASEVRSPRQSEWLRGCRRRIRQRVSSCSCNAHSLLILWFD